MSKKPQIRFGHFTNDWTRFKLDEFVSFYSGLTYTPDDVRNEGTLVLRSSNVSAGEVVHADDVYVDPSVVNSDNVREGDIIVVVRNGSRALIGKHAEIKKAMPNTVIGAFMTGIRSAHPSFVNALLNTPHFDEEIAMNLGATINQITGYMFSRMEFVIPLEEKEQDAIGLFFKNLDNGISYHQRKYEKLLQLKRSMLQKVFPHDGATSPDIRFDGFTGEWQARSFGELFAPNKERNEGKFSIERTISVASMRFNPDGNGGNESYFATYKVLRLGDIAFEGNKSKDYRYGRFVVNDIGDGIMSPRFPSFRPIVELDVSFWKYYIHNEQIMRSKLAKSTKAGTLMSELVPEDFLNETILVPSLPEQKRIGEYLEKLNDLVCLQHTKLEKLIRIKKSLLSRMFA